METSGTVTAGDLDRTATYLADDFAFEGPIAHYRSAAGAAHARAVASPRRHASAVELNPTQPGVTLAVGWVLIE
jgi:hypothetical protein